MFLFEDKKRSEKVDRKKSKQEGWRWCLLGPRVVVKGHGGVGEVLWGGLSRFTLAMHGQRMCFPRAGWGHSGTWVSSCVLEVVLPLSARLVPETARQGDSSHKQAHRLALFCGTCLRGAQGPSLTYLFILFVYLCMCLFYLFIYFLMWG